MDKNDPIFSVEHQFGLYAELVKINKKNVSPTQWIETRRAFFGAWGQLLFLMRDDLTQLSDDDGVDVMETMKNEVVRFWNLQGQIHDEIEHGKS